MIRYYVFKDGVEQGSMATREQAVEYIKALQRMENHPILKAEFSIIRGELEFIHYDPVK